MSARTILNPPLTNELNGLFDGSTAIDVASVNIGTSPSNVLLSVNAPGSLVVGGTITTTGGLTAQNGVCVLGNGANSVQLTGTTGTLSVAGGVTAFGAIINGECNAVSFGGGILAGTSIFGISIPANSGTSFTIPVSWNPVSGWLGASTVPILTLASEYGSVGVVSVVVNKTSATTADIVAQIYNPNPTNPQQLFTVNYLLIYQ